MKKVILYFVFVSCIISAPYWADRLVDWQFQEGHTQEEADARSELVVRAVREAEERKQRTVKKLSLSEQAMIVRNMYGY